MVAMRHPLFAFVLALLTSLALATSARAQTTTWYVSNGLEFGHFDTIQGAVDAAADGDLILVRRGHYPAFTVDDKALTIAGEFEESVWVEVSSASAITVQNLAAEREVRIHDVNVMHAGATPVGAVFLHDNVGAVRLANMVVGSTHTFKGPHSLRVVSCDDVEIVECGFAQGVLARLSDVRMHDSFVHGPGGYGCGVAQPAKVGEPGIEVLSGSVLLADTVVRGGRGGDGAGVLNCCNAQGGPGLRLGTDVPAVMVRGGSILGGLPGTGLNCASFGAPIDVLSGAVLTQTGATPTGGFVAAWAQGGAPSALVARGEPGQGLLVGLSLGQAQTPVPVIKGDLLLALPLLLTVPLGPADGFEAGFPGLMPFLPPGMELDLFAQTAANDPIDGVILGPRDRVRVLDLQASLAGTADCDNDGVRDVVALWSGAAQDDDANGVPDACQSFLTLHVDDDAPGDPLPGSTQGSDPLADGSAAHPFDSLQAAVDAVPAGTFAVIEVAPGVYGGTGNFGVALQDERVLVRGAGKTQTVFDLAGQGRLLTVTDGSRVALEGFAIENGLDVGTGGAVGVSGSMLRARDMRFTGNTSLAGGAVYSYASEVWITDTEFVANHATEDGGALYEYTPSFASGAQPGVRIERTAFFGNSAASEGGALASSNKTIGPRVVSSTFLGNTADLNGGAVYMTSSTAVFESCHFGDNAAAYNGGALFSKSTSTPFYRKPFTLRQCTLRGNYAFISGAGIHGYGAVVEGSIFWGNLIEPSILSIEIAPFGTHNTTTFFTGAFETPEFVLRDTTLEYGVAGISGLGATEILAGPGMSTADPLFALAGSASPALAPGSPAIDTGGAVWVPPMGATDVEGEPRVQGAALDRGADEF